MKRKLKKRARRVKRRKQSEKSARRHALRNWSLKVRKRDGFKCRVCGSDKYTQAHHILEKKYYKTLMLDPNVGVTLCSGCHAFRKYAAHTNPIWFVRWLQKNAPEQYQWVMERVGDRDGKDTRDVGVDGEDDQADAGHSRKPRTVDAEDGANAGEAGG